MLRCTDTREGKAAVEFAVDCVLPSRLFPCCHYYTRLGVFWIINILAACLLFSMGSVGYHSWLKLKDPSSMTEKDIVITILFCLGAYIFLVEVMAIVYFMYLRSQQVCCYCQCAASEDEEWGASYHRYREHKTGEPSGYQSDEPSTENSSTAIESTIVIT